MSLVNTVAALYVERGGVYFGLDGVEEQRRLRRLEKLYVAFCAVIVAFIAVSYWAVVIYREWRIWSQ